MYKIDDIHIVLIIIGFMLAFGIGVSSGGCIAREDHQVRVRGNNYRCLDAEKLKAADAIDNSIRQK